MKMQRSATGTDTLPKFDRVYLGNDRCGPGAIIRTGGKTHGLTFTGEARADDMYPGCDYRMYLDGTGARIGVNVVQTGKTETPRWGGFWIRGRVEYVGDGEPSTFDRCWIRVP